MGSKENQIKSPLTNSYDTILVEEFCTEKIIRLYQEQLNLKVDRFFKDLKVIKLYRCKKTGYLFYSPFSAIGDDLFYKDLSINRLNYYSTRWEHKIALKFISKNEKILEIGSGFGAFINLLKENERLNVTGLELNPVAIEKCKSLGLNVKNNLIQEEAISNFEKYDIVCYFQVLEHITEVNDFIKASIDSLKKGGKLIIGVPNNNPYLFVSDKWHTLNLPPHHAGLWNKKSLKSLEKVFSLKMQSIEFEPLDKDYNYFLKIQLENSSFIKQKILKVFNKFFPGILKKIYCNFIEGRNVLVVFTKE